jgi:hypothetical protein
MLSPASFAVVLLRNEILEQALHDSRQTRVELRERYHLRDETLRHLIEVLLHEKRQGFQSGAFFLDGIAGRSRATSFVIIPPMRQLERTPLEGWRLLLCVDASR